MARDVNDILPRMRILPLSLVVLLAPIAIAPYNQKVPPRPRTATRLRNVTDTSRFRAQFVTVTVLMAAPRTFNG